MASERTGAERYFDGRMADPEFRDAYLEARSRIDAIDAVIRAFEARRTQLGLSKAELARRAGMKPESVRRLLSAERPNPRLSTLVALATPLGLDLVPRSEHETAAS